MIFAISIFIFIICSLLATFFPAVYGWIMITMFIIFILLVLVLYNIINIGIILFEKLLDLLGRKWRWTDKRTLESINKPKR